MKNDMQFFAALNKAEKQDDGTIIVTGIASTEDKDSDGEIITADAMKAALPEYMRFGNIREMHQLKAAGVALDAFVNETGETVIKAHIVDAEAIKKVEAGVYKGFSIGGKKTQRDTLNKAIITGILLREVSLVDRPCNPKAVFEMYKADGATETKENDMTTKAEKEAAEKKAADEAVIAKAAQDAADALEKATLDLMAMDVDDLKKVGKDETSQDIQKRAFTAKQRKTAAKSGSAMPDGSFPIENAGDLANAVKAVGRAKDEAKAKKHILARAKALGLTDKLPEGWTTAKTETKKTDVVVDDKAAKPTDLKKGMYGVSNLASLLGTLDYLQQACEVEEDLENDDSEVPAKLAAAAKILGDILIEMTTEEVGELVGDDDDADKATRTLDLAKIGKLTMPKETKLGKVVAFIKAAKGDNNDELAKLAGFTLEKKMNSAEKSHAQTIHDHSVGMGAECTGDDDYKAAKPGDLAKASDAARETIKDELVKAIGVTEEITFDAALAKVTEIVAERDTITKAHTELKAKFDALPEPAKGALLSLSKAGDVTKDSDTTQEQEIEKVGAEIDGIKDPVAKAAALVKAIHARGGRPLESGFTAQ